MVAVKSVYTHIPTAHIPRHTEYASVFLAHTDTNTPSLYCLVKAMHNFGNIVKLDRKYLYWVHVVFRVL